MPRPTSPPTTPPAIASALGFLDTEAEPDVAMDATPVDLEAPIPVDSGAAE